MIPPPPPLPPPPPPRPPPPPPPPVPREPQDPAARITEHVYLGSLATLEADPSAFPYVLSMISLVDPLPAGVQHLSIPIMDVPSTSLFPHIESALEFLDKAVAANARVLVHCYAGVSRSAAMVAAHLITRHGSSYRDATAKMRSVRRGVAPNRGFAYQLRVLECLVCANGTREWDPKHPLVLHTRALLLANAVYFRPGFIKSTAPPASLVAIASDMHVPADQRAFVTCAECSNPIVAASCVPALSLAADTAAAADFDHVPDCGLFARSSGSSAYFTVPPPWVLADSEQRGARGNPGPIALECPWPAARRVAGSINTGDNETKCGAKLGTAWWGLSQCVGCTKGVAPLVLWHRDKIVVPLLLS